MSTNFLDEDGLHLPMDEQVFRDFFGTMYPLLVRYARRVVDSETAHDVASQTLNKIWEKRLGVPCTEIEWRRLRSLSYRICDGYTANAVRAQLRRAALAERMDSYAGGNSAREVPNVADAVIAADVTVRVLAQLQGRERRMLALLLKGYKTSEIAVELNCSPATARAGVKRVRLALRRVVESEPGSTDVRSGVTGRETAGRHRAPTGRSDP